MSQKNQDQQQYLQREGDVQKKKDYNLENKDLRGMLKNLEKSIFQLKQRIEQLEQLGDQNKNIQQLESQITSQIQIDREKTCQNEKLLKENIMRDLVNHVDQKINNFINQASKERKSLSDDSFNQINKNQQTFKVWITNFQNSLGKQSENYLKLENQQIQIQNMLSQIQQSKLDEKPYNLNQKIENLDQSITQIVRNLRNELLTAIQQKQDQIQQLSDQQNYEKQIQDILGKKIDQSIQQSDERIKQVQIECQQQISLLNQTISSQFNENYNRIQQEINQNKTELNNLFQNMNPQNEAILMQLNQTNDQIQQQLSEQKTELTQMIQNLNPSIEVEQFKDQLLQYQNQVIQQQQFNDQLQQQINKLMQQQNFPREGETENCKNSRDNFEKQWHAIFNNPDNSSFELIQRINQSVQLVDYKKNFQQLQSQITSQIQIDREKACQNEKILKENILNHVDQKINDFINQASKERKNLSDDSFNQINKNQQTFQEWINNFQNSLGKQQENYLKLENQQIYIQNMLSEIPYNLNQKIDQSITQIVNNLIYELQIAFQQKQKQIQQLSDQQNQQMQIQDILGKKIDQSIQLSDQKMKQVQIECQQQISLLNQTISSQFNENYNRIQQEINQNKTELNNLFQNMNPQNEAILMQLNQTNDQIQQQLSEQKTELIQMIQNINPSIQVEQFKDQLKQQINEQTTELIEMIRNINNQNQVIQQQQFKEQLQQQINKLRGELNEIQHNQNTPSPKSQIIPIDQPSSSPEIIQIPQKTIISFLYDKTCRARSVDPQFKRFVQDVKYIDELYREYGVRSLQNKQFLAANLSGMRKVRGNGNCFYTAFVFQYLKYLIIDSTDLEFQNLIEEIQTLPFEVIFENHEFQQSDFQILKQSFTKQCQELRQLQKENRLSQFEQLFQDDDCEFYGLAVVFIRNLAYKVCNNEEINMIFTSQGYNMKQELLKWEHDCQSNQPVIAQLSQYLKINIYLYFFESSNVAKQEYKFTENPPQDTKIIHLLFRPGHYCIGLPVY